MGSDGIKEVRGIRTDLESELSSNVALLRACRAPTYDGMGAGLEMKIRLGAHRLDDVNSRLKAIAALHRTCPRRNYIAALRPKA